MFVQFEAKEIVVRLLTPMLQHHTCYNRRVKDMSDHCSSIHVNAIVSIFNTAAFRVGKSNKSIESSVVAMPPAFLFVPADVIQLVGDELCNFPRT